MNAEELKALYHATLSRLIRPPIEKHVNPKTTAWMRRETARTEAGTLRPEEESGRTWVWSDQTQVTASVAVHATAASHSALRMSVSV